MAFEMPKETTDSRIREVTLGTTDVKVGGENVMPFCLFEGEMPNRPLIAVEVYDDNPQEWSPVVAQPLADVLADPVAWARKAQDEWGADIIALRLRSTDPKGDDNSPEEAAQTVKAVAEAVDIPVIVYGPEDVDKDGDVLKAAAIAAEGKNVVLGPAMEDNYKTIGAAALGYKQTVAAKTPIDVNLAKQLNILLSNLGVDTGKIIVDPTTGALGYGLEYTYSVMERLKLAALQQDDTMTQMPLMADVGVESWKAKEAKFPAADEPAWGDENKRGVMWEIITATTLLVAGADIVIMRHPDAIKTVREVIDNLMG
ncbi:MAG: acetyl-CoA decarbonylase/synthase complex subunit delta [Actinobacteria bacterium]|nr:acetyl-CoA decarbonylase/synthase complex subunit delta [Actinomycetota bacterium]MBU4178739.1 acetyl-CoA decarbonylase/synthase complex subunit delta [Actinomycetota bacterium]MBU4219298.1 acetyl-CoA decarbonylase/synthase complex subunit delta [Actinomycetota bacterium]MBU4359582.1 acetyl-CoA decarbonylase/synthase complex subunit delta [Actinomycetota bacterium]MBU4402019.1 acetyl-CoA decarbonylase/synthase complex subunit delta [Actinomycetota bacterium]